MWVVVGEDTQKIEVRERQEARMGDSPDHLAYSADNNIGLGGKIHTTTYLTTMAFYYGLAARG